VLIGFGPDLDFFDLDRGLFLAGFLQLFLLLILEAPKSMIRQTGGSALGATPQGPDPSPAPCAGPHWWE
jgi:hypothetical protein